VSKRAAGMVVLRRGAEGWRCLLLRAYRNWDFPKGLVEEGEAPWAAALREVAEETGLAALRFPFGEDGCDTAPYAGGKVARYFLAEAPAGEVYLPVSAELGRPEHHEFRWAGWDEAQALLPPRLQPVLAWARARVEGGGAA
jgi:8-oxo-dGTP pyrophosphatase MutT (NUDIX family)